MFLSLKGALGRNPMINRVGQRLLQAFEGASAAYSLRDLASNIASVVRVRRASDNTEKDFSAADVSSGAMTEWVNAQVVPPLDVRELVDGERTGALIPAAAAYSLRNLSASYTGNVVQVRRSSDDAEDSFTAAEVADGTLVDWVNADVVLFNPSNTTASGWWVGSNISFSAGDDYMEFTGAGGRGTAGNMLGTGAVRKTDGSYSITFDAKYVSGGSLALGEGYGGSDIFNVTSASNGGEWTSYTVSVNPWDGSSLSFSINRRVIFSSSNGTVWQLRNVEVSQVTADGFVSQWYDQSGNGNHATQGADASQPKIVSGGSLVSGGLDFDGVNDGLSVSGQVLTSSSFYAASVMNHATGTSTANNQSVFGQYQVSTSGRFYLVANNSNEYSFFANATDPISGFGTGAIGTAQTLISVNGDGSNAEIWRDGTSKATDTYSGFTPANVNFTIGIDAEGDREFNGKIAEVIIYDSDQSDNRTAFEANIGETYGIDLPSGVDTGYDQVDGFVETWYDQSGNGSDLTQTTAAYQPLIVSGGVLTVDSLGNVAPKPDGVNDFLASSLVPPSTASIFAVADASTLSGFTAIYGSRDAPDERSYIGKTDSQFSVGVASEFISSGTFSGNSLLSLVYNGSTINLHANGVSEISQAQAQSVDNASQGYVMFAQNNTGAQIQSFTDAPVAELIIYNSDQSANRAAIEANINNQYDIY